MQSHIPTRISSLDGLRAASIVLVLLEHATQHIASGSQLGAFILILCGNGTVGVSVFFVISGFLITTLLIEEKENYENISLVNFYTRRVFRIIPAFSVFLLTVAVLANNGSIRMKLSELMWPATFTSDYHFGLSWYVVHTWSLSVEEQFYLIWPLLFSVLRQKTLASISAAVILAEPFVRLVTYHVNPEHNTVSKMAHTRADMLMFGCIAALCFNSKIFRSTLNMAFDRVETIPFCVIFLVILTPIATYYFHGAYLYSIGYTATGICITLVMLHAVLRPQALLGRILNVRPAVYLGQLSYSIYLWQQLFIGAQKLSVLGLAVALAGALLIAAASYYIIEQPCIRLRKRLGFARTGVGATSQAPRHN